MFKNFIHSQLLKPIFVSRNHCETQIYQKLSNFGIYFFNHSVMSPFAVQLFLLPFSSHCSKQNISFSHSGYVIKPLQQSSAIYGASPFTRHLFALLKPLLKDITVHFFFRHVGRITKETTTNNFRCIALIFSLCACVSIMLLSWLLVIPALSVIPCFCFCSFQKQKKQLHKFQLWMSK